ncbi:MAG: putative toxin-antitoxin system toxin component, PIN family [Candidatus Omnitrophica bacterium]|nr:putative toxin-antitoxin system toxin component, PIN family [Candidatus Omnitrophota bacterium]
MRVVFDSNVWIAAFVASGTSRDLVEETLEVAEVFVSSAILEEIDRILSEKFDETVGGRLEVRHWLKQVCQLAEPSPREDISCRDKKDLPILWLALFVHADFIVTGDQDLLELKEVQGIKIAPPRLFWHSLIISP